MLKIFFDISTGFRFSKISVECSVHLCSSPWIKLPFDADVDEKFLNVIYIYIYLLDRRHDVVVVVVIVLLSEKYDIQW